jgi:hypothetical protein
MTLSEMIAAIRIELQDPDPPADIWSDATLTRAVEKSVSLMSRLLPKRSIVETVIGGEVTEETLTIASSTGTLAYKPIKVGSLVIANKTLNTDYRVNHLTGVVTEIGNLLPDGDYTVSYELDPRVLNYVTLIPDCIKVERMEHPAGQEPPSYPTFDIVGDYLFFRGEKASFTEGDYVRLTYLGAWTAPGGSAGDYPTHLDDVVIIGSVGQSLIFKAEEYSQQGLSALAAGKAILDGITAVTFPSAPDISSYITAAGTALDAAITRFQASVTALGSMDTPLSDAGSALDKLDTELLSEAVGAVSAKSFLKAGDDFINAANYGGPEVSTTYQQYAMAEVSMADEYAKAASQRVAIAAGWETKAARENTVGVSYVQEAIQRLASASRLLDKYQFELVSSGQEIEYYRSKLDLASRYEAEAQRYLEIAGRFLASGQAKINEFLIALGYKPEFVTQKAAGEQR